MNPNKRMFRNLAARSFWRSRDTTDRWSIGYWYGLHVTYKYASEHM